MDDFFANRAFVLIGFQRRLAARAEVAFFALDRLARRLAFALQQVLVEQSDGQQVMSQSEAPYGQPTAFVREFQVADAGMVVMF